MKKVVIIGSSGHAKVVTDIIEKQGIYEIAGYLDEFKSKKEKVLGYKILGAEEDLPKLYLDGIKHAVIAIGDNFVRSKVKMKIDQIGPKIEFMSVIHPNAQIARNVVIGFGTVIMAGVVINTDTSIGNFCILNTKSSVDHDGVMKDYSSLAPCATLGANVTIDEYSAVCIGANIKHQVKIGKHTVIGASSLVLKDIPDFVVAYGIPAKIIRKRAEGEKYL